MHASTDRLLQHVLMLSSLIPSLAYQCIDNGAAQVHGQCTLESHEHQLWLPQQVWLWGTQVPSRHRRVRLVLHRCEPLPDLSFSLQILALAAQLHQIETPGGPEPVAVVFLPGTMLNMMEDASIGDRNDFQHAARCLLPGVCLCVKVQTLDTRHPLFHPPCYAAPPVLPMLVERASSAPILTGCACMPTCSTTISKCWRTWPSTCATRAQPRMGVTTPSRTCSGGPGTKTPVTPAAWSPRPTGTRSVLLDHSVPLLC